MQRNLLAILLLGTFAAVSAQAVHAEGYKAGATGSTSTTVDANRGVKATAADASITAKVKSSLIGDDLVKARNINVDTIGGKVSLTGTVKSQAEAQQAVQLAKQVNGVADVQNNLTIQP
jgi:hyperosmotically inducible periplasmic protein